MSKQDSSICCHECKCPPIPINLVRVSVLETPEFDESAVSQDMQLHKRIVSAQAQVDQVNDPGRHSSSRKGRRLCMLGRTIANDAKSIAE